MSRRANTDPDFNSDSFLDIIANIVGILIILIVIAGVKVARQPAEVVSSPSDSRQVLTSKPGEPQQRPRDSSGEGPDSAPSPLVSPALLTRLEECRDGAFAAAAALTHEARKMESRHEHLAARRTHLTSQLAELTAADHQNQADTARSARRIDESYKETEAIRERIGTLQPALAELQADAGLVTRMIDAAGKRRDDARDQLATTAQESQRLTEVLEQAARRVEPTTERIRHRMSPVATATSEQELHFQIRDGRVAFVPIDALLERMRQQVSGRADLIRRLGGYEGVVGPEGGFVMDYRVERQSVSPLQIGNLGQSAFRVVVSRWQVAPGETLAAETIPDALRPGSRFRQVVEAAELDATITIWVYPEDFSEFPPLREFVHGIGLRVAARPLPSGVPITGSPGGSRSSAQ